MQYQKAYRQGEVLIFKISQEEAKRQSAGLKEMSERVIREGEQSGHKHEITGDAQLKLFANTGDGVIEVGKEGATVKHPEHKDIKLKEGSYAVRTQKEAKVGDPGASVKVKD